MTVGYQTFLGVVFRMCFCGVFLISAGYRFSPDICTDGFVFSILMIFPAGYLGGAYYAKSGSEHMQHKAHHYERS